MSDKKKSTYNPFVATDIYPEAVPIFSFMPKAPEKMKDKCHIILDTNALLVPYSTGKASLDKIQDVFQTLTKSERLLIPGQVAREFAKNRAGKMTELYQQLSVSRSKVPQLVKGRYPLLESLNEYQVVLNYEKKIDQQVTEYRDALDKVLKIIKKWTWNDPVSMVYAELFSSSVMVDPEFNQEDILVDLNRRVNHNIPPGYKDSGKEDGGIGDLLIWHTILHIGKEHKNDILFVSGDGKPDWWHRSEKQPLFPRYELVDEYRRASGGKSFQIVKFSDFLKLFGVSNKIVEEIRNEERQKQDELVSKKIDFSLLSRSELAVYNWLKTQGREVIYSDGIADFTTVDNVGNRTGYSVIFIDTSIPISVARVNLIVKQGSSVVNSGEYDCFVLFIVSPNIDFVANPYSYLPIDENNNIKLVTATVMDGELTNIHTWS